MRQGRRREKTSQNIEAGVLKRMRKPLAKEGLG